MFVFDTDHVSVLQRREEPARSVLLARMQTAGRQNCFLNVVSFHEQVLGWNAYLNGAKRKEDMVRGYGMFEDLLDEYGNAPLLSFDAVAAQRLDELEGRNLRIGAMDLRIAAIAIAHDMTLLTRNLRDFGRIDDLRTDDWTRPA